MEQILSSEISAISIAIMDMENLLPQPTDGQSHLKEYYAA